MVRVLFLVLLLTLRLSAAEQDATSVETVAAPSHANAIGVSLAAAPDGAVWLTWLERVGAVTQLRFAAFDRTSRQWSPAATIAQGPDWFVNRADFPAVTIGRKGQATAVWFVNNPPTANAGAAHDHNGSGYRAWVARTVDAGKSWSAPALLTSESRSVEFVSLATLADGRVLAAWLDGRNKALPGAPQQVFARILGSNTPDQQVAAVACDCCQTALTAFPDGSALLAYRGRTADETRDIRVARFHGEQWSDARELYFDGWKINGCPVNGPQLASDGGRVAAAWFSASDGQPRVSATFSSDAGARFMSPVRVAEGKVAGRVATTLLHDGAILVSWVDADGAAWLRRISPDFSPSPPVRLTGAEQGRAVGFPRMALLRDYQGGTAPAEILVALALDAEPNLQTLLVKVPEGQLLQAEKNCDCAPTEEELLGFPMRGVITAADAATRTLQVRHQIVPGIFEAGDHTFAVSSTIAVAPENAGRSFLGRIESVDGRWQIIQLRLIAAPP